MVENTLSTTDWASRMKDIWCRASLEAIVSCRVCGLVSKMPTELVKAHCPRCDSALYFRKPCSISRTWALLIASYILYIPANFLIMMETGSLISYRRDTIMSGVIHLWNTGSQGIAIVVFVASIIVPLFKLLTLTMLLVSVSRHSLWGRHERLRLYRIVEFVGRWSMLDVYVVTLLAAIVQLGSLAVVKAGPAAIPFGAVVVLTMFAAQQFDPRLLWDTERESVKYE